MSDTADRFVLGVDLDGVVCDFYRGLRPIAAEWLGVPLETLPLEVRLELEQMVGEYQDRWQSESRRRLAGR